MLLTANLASKKAIAQLFTENLKISEYRKEGGKISNLPNGAMQFVVGSEESITGAMRNFCVVSYKSHDVQISMTIQVTW